MAAEVTWVPWTVSLHLMNRRCNCHKWEVQNADLTPIKLETCVLLDYGKHYLSGM